MNRNDYFLTVIVPIYNVENYLAHCLESLKRQTHKDFKIVLIDDGSTDNSSKIAKDFADSNPNVEYVRQENKGLGGARNTGLNLVDTKYAAFLDSDDVLAPKTVELIRAKLDKYGEDVDIIFTIPVIYDMVVKAYQEWYDYTFLKRLFKEHGPEVVNPSQIPELMSIEACFWRGVYRTEFLKKEAQIIFVEHLKWEDVPTHFELIHNAKKAVMLEEPTFIYRTNQASQITSGTGKGRLDLEGILNEVLPLFKKDYSKREKAFMIDFLSKYLEWHYLVISDEYVSRLVDIYHNFFRKISLRDYFAFYRCGACMKSRLFVWGLRSRLFYKKFKDKNKAERLKARFDKVKRLARR